MPLCRSPLTLRLALFSRSRTAAVEIPRFILHRRRSEFLPFNKERSSVIYRGKGGKAACVWGKSIKHKMLCGKAAQTSCLRYTGEARRVLHLPRCNTGEPRMPSFNAVHNSAFLIPHYLINGSPRFFSVAGEICEIYTFSLLPSEVMQKLFGSS